MIVMDEWELPTLAMLVWAVLFAAPLLFLAFKARRERAAPEARLALGLALAVWLVLGLAGFAVIGLVWMSGAPAFLFGLALWMVGLPGAPFLALALFYCWRGGRKLWPLPPVAALWFVLAPLAPLTVLGLLIW